MIVRRNRFLTVSCFFLQDLKKRLEKEAEKRNLEFAYEIGKGFITYAVTIQVIGDPAHIEKYFAFLPSIMEEYHFTSP